MNARVRGSTGGNGPCALLVCPFSFVLSKGDAALGVYVAIRLGHLGNVLETTLPSRVNRWVASLECLVQ